MKKISLFNQVGELNLFSSSADLATMKRKHLSFNKDAYFERRARPATMLTLSGSISPGYSFCIEDPAFI